MRPPRRKRRPRARTTRCLRLRCHRRSRLARGCCRRNHPCTCSLCPTPGRRPPRQAPVTDRQRRKPRTAEGARRRARRLELSARPSRNQRDAKRATGRLGASGYAVRPEPWVPDIGSSRSRPCGDGRGACGRSPGPSGMRGARACWPAKARRGRGRTAIAALVAAEHASLSKSSSARSSLELTAYVSRLTAFHSPSFFALREEAGTVELSASRRTTGRGCGRPDRTSPSRSPDPRRRRC